MRRAALAVKVEAVASAVKEERLQPRPRNAIAADDDDDDDDDPVCVVAGANGAAAAAIAAATATMAADAPPAPPPPPASMAPLGVTDSESRRRAPLLVKRRSTELSCTALARRARASRGAAAAAR